MAKVRFLKLKEPHVMDQALIVPRVAFVINIASGDSPRISPPRLRHLVHLFRSHRIHATWALEDARIAALLQEQSAELSADHVALSLRALESDPSLAAREFGGKLTAKMNSLASSLSEPPGAVLSSGSALRSRLPLLSDWGIHTVIRSSQVGSTGSRPRALACGLWQVTPSINLPRRSIWQRLVRRGPSVRELSAAAVDDTVVVGVNSTDFGKQSARHIQSFEKFLREASWGASRGQIELCSVAEIVAGLRERHQVRPQQSILKVAA